MIRQLITFGKKRRVYFVFHSGQSNAVAVNEAGDIGADPAWTDPEPLIQIQYEGTLAAHTAPSWADMELYVNTADYSYNGNAWGAEQTLMRALQAHANDVVYIIKIAIGGIPISKWLPNPSGADYEKMYTRMHALLSWAISTFDLTQVEIIPLMLWQQGESDELLGRSTADYQFNMENVLLDVRSIHRVFKHMPCIATLLSPEQTYLGSGYTTINDAFLNIEAIDPLFATIDTQTLDGGINADAIHFNDTKKMAMGTAVFELAVSKGWI